MIAKHILAAVVAGLLASVLMTVVQQARVVPLILYAEQFEGAPADDSHQHESRAPLRPALSTAALDVAAVLVAPSAAQAHGSADDHAEEGGMLFGLDRLTATLLANLVAGCGFALLMAAASLLTGQRVTVANGVAWGLAGWLALHFLPAIGLPPELPGFPAADLAARQMWWGATVLLSAVGIGLVALRREPALKALGVLALLAPHAFGAPQPPELTAAVPAVVAAEYAVAALGASLVFWVVLGPLYGWLSARFAGVAAEARA